MGTPRNARHEIFAQGLADAKSQERACIDAGYSAKGSRGSANGLLKQKPEIYERVRELLSEKSSIRLQGLKQAAEKVGVDKAWVLRSDNLLKMCRWLRLWRRCLMRTAIRSGVHS